MDKQRINKVKSFIRELIYINFASTDHKCLVCDQKTSAIDEYICKDCTEALSVDTKNKCRICGRLTKEEVCRYCRENKKPYEKSYNFV